MDTSMDHSSDNFKSRPHASVEPGQLIEFLQLIRHPEGGWYRETWRSQVCIGDRAAGSVILFLLEAGQRSQWHQVDADEFWLWHAGSVLDLGVADESGSNARRAILGPDVLSGQQPQMLIPAGYWQSAIAFHGWALVSCVVTPGFEFAGFALASPESAALLDTAISLTRTSS